MPCPTAACINTAPHAGHIEEQVSRLEFMKRSILCTDAPTLAVSRLAPLRSLMVGEIILGMTGVFQ